VNEPTRGRLPHTLHLTIDKRGWLAWSLDCPYSATEVEDVPGRPCNLVEENPGPYPKDPEDRWVQWSGSLVAGEGTLVYNDNTGEPVVEPMLSAWLSALEAQDNWSSWVKIPGCFAKQYLEESGEWDDIIRLDRTDPSFPVEVDVEVEGSEDDAYVSALTPWADDGVVSG
jgi:hypothetical protein